MSDSEVVNKVKCTSCPTGKVGWEKFIGHVSLYAQGAPDEIYKNAVRDAAIDFAERTNALQHTWCFDLQDCVDYYSMEIDDCYTIKDICSVCVCGREWEKAIKWAHCPKSCTWYYEAPCDLYIHPAPNCDIENGLEVTMTIQPGQDSCAIDKIFYDKYAHHIANGALERLLLIKNTAWYDPSSAGLYGLKFRKSIAQVKSQVARNHTSGPLFAEGAQCYMP